MKKKANFEFRYEGESHSIDINTLLVSQFQYTTILSEIKNQINPKIELKIRIQGFERNSFDINQIIEITTITGLLFFENIDYINQIFKIFKSYLDIKKLLDGKKPDKIEKIGNNNVSLTVNVNGENNTIIVDEKAFNIFQSNYQVNKAITKNGEILESDPEIKGIQIINKETKEKIIDIPRKDFKYLLAENPYMNKETNEIIIDDAILYIRKLEILPKKNSKWDFIYDGRKINSVKILDENFLKKVREGMKFGNGDRLKGKLRILQKLDPETGAYLDDKYELIEVKQVIHKPKQNNLFE